jgi:DNA-binding transcriptional ArsR family regulator
MAKILRGAVLHHEILREHVRVPVGVVERRELHHGVAERCDRLLAALGSRADVGLKKWSMPVLAVLGGSMRFSELREALPGVTARAFALALKDLRAAGYVEREVVDDYPQTAIYRLTRAGSRLRGILG